MAGWAGNVGIPNERRHPLGTDGTGSVLVRREIGEDGWGIDFSGSGSVLRFSAIPGDWQRLLTRRDKVTKKSE
jgi:hypothetical protein